MKAKIVEFDSDANLFILILDQFCGERDWSTSIGMGMLYAMLGRDIDQDDYQDLIGLTIEVPSVTACKSS